MGHWYECAQGVAALEDFCMQKNRGVPVGVPAVAATGSPPADMSLDMSRVSPALECICGDTALASCAVLLVPPLAHLLFLAVQLLVCKPAMYGSRVIAATPFDNAEVHGCCPPRRSRKAALVRRAAAVLGLCHAALALSYEPYLFYSSAPDSFWPPPLPAALGAAGWSCFWLAVPWAVARGGSFSRCACRACCAACAPCARCTRRACARSRCLRLCAAAGFLLLVCVGRAAPVVVGLIAADAFADDGSFWAWPLLGAELALLLANAASAACLLLDGGAPSDAVARASSLLLRAGPQGPLQGPATPLGGLGPASLGRARYDEFLQPVLGSGPRTATLGRAARPGVVARAAPEAGGLRTPERRALNLAFLGVRGRA